MIFTFCTTCMNRIEFLKQTIFENINIIKILNEEYKNKHHFELSLCNYDSKDYLDDFIYDNFKDELNNILIYNRTYDIKYFNASHAKNIAHKYNNGDILVNIDADNFITLDFCYYIIDIFEKDINSITIGTHIPENSGGYGRIVISKENFIKLDGYNELIDGYGQDDNDLLDRAKKYLNLKVIVLDLKYLKYLSHSDELRMSNHIKDLDINESLKISTSLYVNSLYNNIEKPNEYNGIIFGKKKENNLIFDIGFNDGKSTDLYLNMGFKVIGVDANTELINHCLYKYKKYIDENKLILLNIGISDKIENKKFYINKKSEFSSFDENYGHKEDYNGSFSHTININTIRLSDLIIMYGTPYYIKIDISPYDNLAIDTLNFNNKPRYISLGYSNNDIINKLYNLGYNKFKFISQYTIKECKFNNEYLIHESAGYFGENLDGEWLTYDEISKIVNIDGWNDIHATYDLK